MKKTLFFYVYCDINVKDIYPIYKIHFECIKTYKHIFNDIIFILGFNENDISNTDFVNEWKTYITNFIDFNKELTFKLVNNHSLYKECIHFINEIFINLDTFDGLICWGHSKRDLSYNQEYIQNWVIMLHYQLYSNVDEVENILLSDNNICTVGPLSTHLNFNQIFYTGAFFWWYPKKILKLHLDEYKNILNYFKTANYFNNLYNYTSDVFQIWAFCEQVNMIFLPLYSIGQKTLIPYMFNHINNGVMAWNNVTYYCNFIEDNKDYFYDTFYNDYLKFKSNILEKIKE